MDSGYELFDHTADVGVRAFAPSLPDLVRVAGQGLYSVIGELVPEGDVRPEQFLFTDGDLPTLLRDYLSELLLIFERDDRMITGLKVDACESGRLQATGESRAVDRERSLLDREVKAITYHGLEINNVDDGYELRYIVDV